MGAPSQVQKLRGDGQPSRVQDNVGAVLNPLAERLNSTPIMGAAPPPWIRPDIISTSGYADVGVPLAPTSFHKDALGYVHVRIALVTAAGAGPNVVAFVFPPGYLQSAVLTFIGTDGAALLTDCKIDPQGSFTVINTLGVGDLVSLSFSFLAEA